MNPKICQEGSLLLQIQRGFVYIFGGIFKIHRIRLANHHHGTNHQLRENVFGYFFMFASKNHKSASNWAMKKHLGCSGYIGMKYSSVVWGLY